MANTTQRFGAAREVTESTVAACVDMPQFSRRGPIAA
jgi:hypothetical protein